VSVTSIEVTENMLSVVTAAAYGLAPASRQLISLPESPLRVHAEFMVRYPVFGIVFGVFNSDPGAKAYSVHLMSERRRTSCIYIVVIVVAKTIQRYFRPLSRLQGPPCKVPL
jgi:hypothetical protein